MPSIRSLLGRRQSAEAVDERRDEPPQVLAVDDPVADDVLASLSADTARSILSALYDQPRTASEVADEVDTSLQNASYHLDNLRESGLVEVADTWYSEKGTEMKVYAPADGAVVLVAGERDDGPSLVDAIRRLVGAVGVLGVLSLVADWIVREVTRAPERDQEVTGLATGEPAATTPIPAGELFFLGGLAMLLVAGAWWWYRSR